MIKHVSVRGTARARGLAIGEELKESINKTWVFYEILFQNPHIDLAECGESYLNVIRSFCSDYAIEIEAMSQASGLHSWQLAALNARTEILNRIMYSSNTCSHILIADAHGGSFSCEFHENGVDITPGGEASICHTNHYLVEPRDRDRNPILENSIKRLKRARSLAGKQDLHSLKATLLDSAGAPDAIYAPYIEFGPFKMGTLCSVAMDLEARELWLTPGPGSTIPVGGNDNPEDSAYALYSL